MFYSQLVLTKKGPLGNVWLAAQLGESRIPKRFASDAKIVKLCDAVIRPAAPFALRLSAHLALGVVRVLSRKSSIILVDANKVMQALQRFESIRQKRARTEDDSEKPAAFEDITLPQTPAKRTRRLSTGSNKFTVQLGRSPGFGSADRTIDKYGRDKSAQDLDLDIVAISFGRGDLHSHTRSRSRSGSLGTPYRAREQDITLAPGQDASFGSQEFAIDLDVPSPGSIGGVSDLVAPSSHDEDGGAEFAAEFGKHLTPRNSPSIRIGPSPMRSVLDIPVGPAEAADEYIPIPDVPDSTVIPEVPTVQADAREASTARAGQATKSGKSKRSSTETARTKRSRGMLSKALLYTEKTEFSAAEVRAWGFDTTDIVHPKGTQRTSKRRRGSVTSSFQSVVFGANTLGVQAPAMENFWQKVVVEPTLQDLGIEYEDPLSPASEKGIRRRGASARELPSDAGSRTMAEPHEVPGGEVPVLPPMDYDMPPPAADDAGGLPPLYPRLADRSPSLKDSSPSKGSFAPSLGHSSSSRGPEFLRDQELTVTAEDREEFRRALRQHGVGRRLTDDLEPAADIPAVAAEVVPRPSVASSAGGDVGMATGPLDADDAAMIPVHDSELQLAEQTERTERVTDSVVEDAPAIGKLNVHSYKVLQLLRNAATEVQEDASISIFQDFVRGTSRRACARTFLNLLSLTSAGYVHVKQQETYGDIEVYRGSLF